jgi:2-oxoglutarate decarboxylase
VIINNQLGFTTPPESARSSEYCTDIAKAVQAPIFHVNGDDPEACVRVARLAFAYRQRFHKDVVIDMVCYRRHGHNEGDDPSYTQPLMYKAIDELRSVRKRYVETLVKRGDITLDEAEQALDDFQSKLQAALDETRQSAPEKSRIAKPPRRRRACSPTSTPASPARRSIASTRRCRPTTPEGFTVHPKLARQFETRSKMFHDGEVDWATAEAFAFGSLLLEGNPVRLAGQDSRRGTFSHRHSTLSTTRPEQIYIPLAHLPDAAGRVLDLRLAAQRVRRARLRVRLLGGRTPTRW